MQWQLWLIQANTLRARQIGRYFAEDIFKSILLNENFWFSNKISLKCIPYGLIDNKPILVQIEAWCRLGANPLSEPTRTPAFWEYLLPPHHYPYYLFISDPFHSKSKRDGDKKKTELLSKPILTTTFVSNLKALAFKMASGMGKKSGCLIRSICA